MRIIVVVSIVGFYLSTIGRAEVNPFEGVTFQEGPSVGNLEGIAEVHIPTGYVFADGNNTRKIMEAMQNPVGGNELGFVAPQDDGDWFVVYEFDDVGYIRDDEKSSLDPEAMLESIKVASEEGNKERRRRGWAPMTILGWEQIPRYNEATHNLEWAIRGEIEGNPVINYNTRLLGRSGVMTVTLVADPSALTATLPKAKSLLAGFSFDQGHKYTEFRQGDKMAEYGLTALVTGGAAAVAVKSGAAKWLWKLVVACAVVVGAFFKKLFSGKKQ